MRGALAGAVIGASWVIAMLLLIGGMNLAGLGGASEVSITPVVTVISGLGVGALIALWPIGANPWRALGAAVLGHLGGAVIGLGFRALVPTSVAVDLSFVLAMVVPWGAALTAYLTGLGSRPSLVSFALGMTVLGGVIALVLPEISALIVLFAVAFPAVCWAAMCGFVLTRDKGTHRPI